MAIQLRKQLTGAWDQVRYSLRQDLDTIESTLNTRLANITTTINTITTNIAGILGVAHGGTGFSSFAKGDLLVGNAVTTLDKLPVGVNGQVLTADSTQLDGVKWSTAAAGGSSIPIETLVDFLLPANTSGVGSHSLTITGGTTLEIAGGALLELTGDVTQDLGSVTMSLEGIRPNNYNLSTIGDIDFLVVGTATTPASTSALVHSKIKNGQLFTGFLWFNNGSATLSATTLATTMTTTQGDDSAAALSASGVVPFVGAAGGALGVGFRLRAPAVPQRRYLRIYLGLFSGTALITVSMPNSAIPAQTLPYSVISANSRVDLLKISYAGQGDLVVTCVIQSGSTPNVVFGYATLSTS